MFIRPRGLALVALLAMFIPKGLLADDGTRISDKYFLVSTELLEPWRFNSDTAVLLASGDWSLVDKEPDFRVRFAGDLFDNPGDDFPAGGYSLRSQDIRLVATGEKQESKVMTLDQNGKTREIGLRSRKRKTEPGTVRN